MDRPCREGVYLVNRLNPFESDRERLNRILEIAGQQHAFLARGDLNAVLALQARRQQLMEGIESLDKEDERVRATLSKIRRLDQDLHCLLSSEVLDIKEKIKTLCFFVDIPVKN